MQVKNHTRWIAKDNFLRAREQDIQIELMWVSRHADTTGNEKVDKLAEEGKTQ